MSTPSATKDDHINIIASLSSLQMHLFKLSLRLETAVLVNKDSQDEFVDSKNYYMKVQEIMGRVYEEHAEILLNDGMRVQSVKADG